MKYTFGQKQYDVLVGEGKGGGDAYTSVLSSSVKHHLCTMNSADEVRTELKKMKEHFAQMDIHYVQCEEDIKKYLRGKLQLWKVIMIMALLTTFIVASLTVFVANNMPIISEPKATVICLVTLSLAYLSYTKGRTYRNQCVIMGNL